MRKRIYHIAFLVIGLVTVVSVMAQSSNVVVKSPQSKEQWSFGNFGDKSNGRLVVEGNKLIISTQNTRHCFFESDFYSFVYLKQSFPYDDCSRSTVTVKIDPLKIGSAGIMMRSGIRLDAANVHLETSATGDVLLFFRKADGETTSYTRVASLKFPWS